MQLQIRIAAFLACAAAPVLAKTWSGFLVDSTCYAIEERNINPTDTDTAVDRDRNYEISYCRPNAHTKSFALIRPSGRILELNLAANAKAAQIVQASGKNTRLDVAVTGELVKNQLQVDSISLVK